MTKKNSYKNEAIFTMNALCRGGLLQAPGFTIPKTNNFNILS